MRYRQLGRSGLTVSVVGLGGNNFGGRLDLEQTRAVVDTAIDCGITIIDTANSYGHRGGSETLLGEVLKHRRDAVVLATKFGSDMGEGPGIARASRWYIRRAVEESLRRLQTDHIDLYQLHFPDGITPMAETLAALDELVDEERSSTPGRPTSPAGRSSTPIGPPGRPARRGSSRPRTTTASWHEAPNGNCFLRARQSG